VDFVEICKVYIGKMIIKAAKRIFNSGKICRSYSDLNFGFTFLEHSVVSAEVNFIPIFAGGHPSEGVKVKRPLSVAEI